MRDDTYIGRFAPTPSGPLHFGSLVAALGSYLDARARGGQWLVRIEDLDPPREMPGAADNILRTLDQFGLHWDGAVLYQSGRIDAYHAALEALRSVGRVYYCTCSRKTLAPFAGVYPGFCRTQFAPPAEGSAAVRFRLPEGGITFEDRLQGSQGSAFALLGDPTILRKDGLFAYQLAVVVDDQFQGVNQVVRGADLLSSTPWQLALQEALGYRTPDYAHLPLIMNADGQKLSKQNLAPALDERARVPLLARALSALGQTLPEGWIESSAAELLQQATARFDWSRIPRCTALAEDALV